jgi:hypothetical protein
VSDLREALMHSASERLAPILMTALAEGLPLVPIAMGMGELFRRMNKTALGELAIGCATRLAENSNRSSFSSARPRYKQPSDTLAASSESS